MRARQIAVALTLTTIVACSSRPPPPVAPPAAPSAEAPATTAGPAEVAGPVERRCPDGTRAIESECVKAEASPTTEPTSEKPEPPPATDPVSTDPMPAPAAPATPAAPAAKPNARDPRPIAARARARALLVAELQALEQLFQATPKSSPDRVQLMRRLAEGYVELEYSALGQPDGAKIAAASRKNALKYYLAIRTGYPSYPKLDEVLYFAGYEYERGGDLPNARALYRELGKKAPTSPLRSRVPASVLKR